MKPKILVVGSSNTDMVIRSGHLPAPGETIIGQSFFMNPGGKGANQAVAAARLGGNVTFICKTGNDIFGKQSRVLLEDEGINTSFLFTDSLHPSGVALITVDDNAENCIVVASGANATLLPSDLKKCRQEIEDSMIILMQLEIPLDTVEFVARTAHAKGRKVILNPAPACALSDAFLKNIAIITPNETEAEILSGIRITDISTATAAAKIIHERGVETVIITLGGNGALVYQQEITRHVPAYKVIPVDTTAAGDVFNGSLAVSLSEGADILKATEYACHASAIAVTRMGAQSSAPYKKEVEALFSNYTNQTIH